MITLKAIKDPKAVPLTSIALLQQTSQSMTWTLWSLFGGSGSLLESLARIRQFYEIDDIKNIMEDGTVSFPRSDTLDEKQGVQVSSTD